VKYLVDTNILIFLCNSKSKPLENKFKTHRPDEFVVSSITVGELIYGVEKSQRKDRNLQAILKILSPFKIIDFDSSDGWEYGKIRADLEKKGTSIGGNDIMIAAQAKRRGLTMITNNTREYKRIYGLHVEDWTT
jgi:tRNA(fMet)-specific endonuclease VapC